MKVNYVKINLQPLKHHQKYEINHICMRKLVLHIMHQRTMIFIFLNKYFIISTIIWCCAVYSDSHQDMMTERRVGKVGEDKRVLQAIYNHMQLHNLFHYNNTMFQQAGACRGVCSVDSYEYWNANIFFMPSVLALPFFSVMYFDHLWN